MRCLMSCMSALSTMRPVTLVILLLIKFKFRTNEVKLRSGHAINGRPAELV